jgi:crossover junction endodeoxyribonuclease RusA
MTIEFVVPGVAQPRGSKRAMPNRAGGRPLMVDTNAKSKPWMAAVAAAASEAMNGAGLIDGALRLELWFNLPRPKSHYGTGKNSARLKASAPHFHESKPDCDKLVRAIGDAMTGVVYRDDAQLATLEVRKRYANGSAGVRVRISEHCED